MEENKREISECLQLMFFHNRPINICADNYRPLDINVTHKKGMHSADKLSKKSCRINPKLIKLCTGIVSIILCVSITIHSNSFLHNSVNSNSIVPETTKSESNQNSIEVTLSLDKIPKHIFITSKKANAQTLFPCHKNDEFVYVEYDNQKMMELLTHEYNKTNKEIDQLMHHIVEQSDLWRYTVINKYGGLYLDTDASCKHRVHDWLELYDLRKLSDQPSSPSNYILDQLLNHVTIPFQKLVTDSNNVINVDMVIGVEFYGMENPKDIQFVQWALLSKPNNPILNDVVNIVLENLNSINDTKGNIEDRTGPKAWTKGILDFIDNHSLFDQQTLQNLFSWKQMDTSGQLIPLRFKESDEVIWLLVLPYRAFGYYGYHPHEIKETPVLQRLVQHSFKGSWK